MDSKELKQAYQGFFTKHEAGKHFIESINQLQQQHIDKAQEDNSLDYLSRSRGIREVIHHIESVMTGGSKK
jgi:aminopeptidase C